eukprot:CAMPEP_0171939756 /NCGR_PEP_ID=MMETSP0993-20121228/36585_1 /TAXON_ID=483369 /ORGANISM="non described non described, Strain CCMP2098" /LENGTH=497 /DNA_ID=CAMNT_0012581669 /DNA_START=49 /DNA_END=1542 /DNA_ORIENTATION=+
MGIDDSLLKRLESAGIHNVEDFFACSEPHLMFAADLDLHTVRKLIASLAVRASPRLQSAVVLLEARQRAQSFMPLRIPSIDAALGGGLSRGTLTEVVGPAGAGKTQMCLMLAAVAGVPEAMGGLGEGTGVLYLDTERKFAAQRLVEIAQHLVPEWYGDGGEGGGGGRSSKRGGSLGYMAHEDDVGSGGWCEGGDAFSDSGGAPSDQESARRIRDLLKNTHVVEVDESLDLMEQLENLETLLLDHNVGLILLDSIAALARKDFHKGPPTKGPASEDSLARDSRSASSSAAESGSAAGFGSGTGLLGTAARANALVAQAAQLKRLADAFNLVVLVTNQVTSQIQERESLSTANEEEGGSGSEDSDGDDDGGDNYGGEGNLHRPTKRRKEARLLDVSCSQAPVQLTHISGSSNTLAMAAPATPSFGNAARGAGSNGGNGDPLGANVIPALGNSWHHCVSTRLVLEQFLGGERTCTIAKSPIAALTSVRCGVTAAGLVELK